MNRKTLPIILSLVVILSLIFSGTALAQSTLKKLSTNFTLVNLSTTAEANVTAAYYRANGSEWTNEQSFTIPQNFGQRIVAQYFDETLSSGQGSVVISSDTELGAVVQVQARNQTPTMGAYTGFTGGAEQFFVPIVLVRRPTASGMTNTQIIIQNLDTNASTDVTVELIPSPGSTLSNISKPPFSIPPNSSYFYDLETDSQVPSQWYGSAIVTAETGKQIAVVVNIFAGANSLQTFNAFQSTAVSDSWSIPQFTSKLPNGLSTPVTFQNLSGAPIAINQATLECVSNISSPSSFSLTNSVQVPDGGSYAFNPVDDPNNLIPDNWSGACTLNAPANIVAYVQMRKPGVNEEFAAYEGFNTNSTNDFVVVPLVSKRQANGFATAVVIQNISSSNSANVILTYTPSADYVAAGGSSTPLQFNHTIAAGANLIQNHRVSNEVTGMPDGWYGTLTVESTNGVPIIGYVQLTNYLGVAGDTLMAHQAFMMANPN